MYVPLIYGVDDIDYDPEIGRRLLVFVDDVLQRYVVRYDAIDGWVDRQKRQINGLPSEPHGRSGWIEVERVHGTVVVTADQHGQANTQEMGMKLAEVFEAAGMLERRARLLREAARPPHEISISGHFVDRSIKEAIFDAYRGQIAKAIADIESTLIGWGIDLDSPMPGDEAPPPGSKV